MCSLIHSVLVAAGLLGDHGFALIHGAAGQGLILRAGNLKDAASRNRATFLLTERLSHALGGLAEARASFLGLLALAVVSVDRLGLLERRLRPFASRGHTNGHQRVIVLVSMSASGYLNIEVELVGLFPRNCLLLQGLQRLYFTDLPHRRRWINDDAPRQFI